MIKKLIFFSIVIAAVVAGSGCGSDCARTDCGFAVTPVFSFRLLNSAGKELLSGPYKQYDTANVALKAKRVDNGAVETIRRNIIIVADTNYLTSFGVSNTHSVYYISVNNTITDSLVFSYNRKETDCCDMSYYSLNKVNTSAVSPPLSLPYHNYPIVK
ncbi:hypothetical protein ESA94_18845 [Lacibacter luteus]|uniref:Uncharacterized protein n=1 Tax=Lacibacter luteus TaxID=2508719 RepID=A0A4Q1CE52_9BACT|nr:hypothetical protein [Lacibacter luteus]RXK58073.1 hypothetical protein ESA94_18845 [Lacibacter luteus]